MDKKKVVLRQEVYKNDAVKIIDWLEDDEVNRYLNESSMASNDVRYVVNNINMPILTHIFNQNGSFFIIDKDREPIGFLKLIPKGKNMEMVVAIGEKEQWGKGLGPCAIFEGLKEAFFNWRVDEVVAKIKDSNHRSKKAFTKVGFDEDVKLTKEIQYSISMKNFLKIAA